MKIFYHILSNSFRNDFNPKYNRKHLRQHLDDCAESFLMSAFHNSQLFTMKASYIVKEGTYIINNNNNLLFIRIIQITLNK